MSENYELYVVQKEVATAQFRVLPQNCVEVNHLPHSILCTDFKPGPAKCNKMFANRDIW